MDRVTTAGSAHSKKWESAEAVLTTLRMPDNEALLAREEAAQAVQAALVRIQTGAEHEFPVHVARALERRIRGIAQEIEWMRKADSPNAGELALNERKHALLSSVAERCVTAHFIRHGEAAKIQR